MNTLYQKLKPSPTIIDCTPAYNELMAKLKQQMLDEGMTEEEINAPRELEWSEEDKQLMEQLDAVLEEGVRYLEEECNIKLVCSE